MSSVDEKKKNVYVPTRAFLSIDQLTILAKKLFPLASYAMVILKINELVGICNINVKCHDNINCTKGTVYAPYLNNIPEKEIIE